MKEVSSDEQISLAVAEYNTLRTEILKRSEHRYQILSLNLVMAGTILTFGLQQNSPSCVLFIFPVLAWFLAGFWIHNMGWTRRASSYIRENIESKYQVIGWETEVAKKPYLGSRLLGVMLSVNGVFLGTQLITMVLGLLKTKFTPIDIVLMACDVICIFATFIALRSRTLEYKKN